MCATARRVAEPGCRHDFTLKASRRGRVFQHGCREHLDGNNPFHAAVLGLEDLSHAARPDPIEDGVVAQEQRFGPALVDFLDLVIGEMLTLNELPGKFLGIFRGCLGRDEILKLAGRDDPGIRQLLHEGFEGNFHRAIRSVRNGTSIIASPRWSQKNRKPVVPNYLEMVLKQQVAKDAKETIGNYVDDILALLPLFA